MAFNMELPLHVLQHHAFAHESIYEHLISYGLKWLKSPDHFEYAGS